MADRTNWMLVCAAKGCERDIRDDSGTIIERVSPPGGLFIGLCQDHIDKTVILKKEAAQALTQEVR